MTDLPERIERGEATEDAVREALGYRKCTARIGAVWWEDASGNRVTLGSLLTCLTTLAAECERRGLSYEVSYNATAKAAWATILQDNDRAIYGRGDAAKALCAALVRAVQEQQS
jgi:hypothetical protein